MSKRTNRGPAELAYKAEARWLKNRARRIEAEANRQRVNALLRPVRLELRKLGALRRITRRCESGNASPHLHEILGLVRAVHKRAST